DHRRLDHIDPAEPDRRSGHLYAARRSPSPRFLSKVAFLTGGTGFVGGNLALALLKDGWRVRALARLESDRGNLEGLDLEIVDGDLLSPNLADLMAGADAVFHVAALYSLWRRDRNALFRSNVLGTRSILEAARNAGVARV